jgi:predicted negative regulator of RcsB-dependent stress response
MTNTLIGVVIAIIVIILAFKFMKSLVKGIVILAVIVFCILFFRYYYEHNPSLNSLPSVFHTQIEKLQQQTAQQMLEDTVEKLKTMDAQQVKKYLEEAKSELEKHGLTVEAVKKALDDEH